MSTLELNREAARPIESNVAIRVGGFLPCEACLGAGWIDDVHDSGRPCEACQELDDDDLALALA